MADLTQKVINANNGSRGFKRILCVSVPAALMTLGLFSAMKAFVHVDDFSPPEQTSYIIEAYMIPKVIKKPNSTIEKPARPEPLQAPPAQPRLKAAKVDIGLDAGTYTGAVPANYQVGPIKMANAVAIGAVIDRTMQPLRPPVLTYPQAAATKGIEGACEVFLSVSPKGKPFDVSADCTNRIFSKAATNAVKKVQFAPKIYNGQAVIVTGVVYPIAFTLE